MPKQDQKNKKTKTATVKKPPAPVKDAEKKKSGGRSQYANKVLPYLSDIARYVRCGVTEGQICEFYGVGKTQWAQYKKDNAELTEILLRSKRELKAEKKKSGGRSQYANKVLPYLSDIARYVRCGVTEGQICEFYGVGKTQWAQYKKDNAELTGILLRSKRELKTDLINKSYEVAMGYNYEETTTVTYKDKDGNITGTKTTAHKKHAKADAGMLQFLLINRYTDEFARDPQMVELRKKALELQAAGKIPPDAEGI